MLAKTAICVVSEHGKIVKEAQVESGPEERERDVRDLDGIIAAIGLRSARGRNGCFAVRPGRGWTSSRWNPGRSREH